MPDRTPRGDEALVDPAFPITTWLDHLGVFVECVGDHRGGVAVAHLVLGQLWPLALSGRPSGDDLDGLRNEGPRRRASVLAPGSSS